ncbi:hypothetical protein Salmuc_00916 [Salipiger mucosus DSM 16094]|uniref:Uncharacterized protein n=1 Tax=Salipiger mucosus DSM 16094 TaxID=1123237 RepID=S9QSN7_9RHOB|nr:hypothetical protein Salmuc_00916 [Salipiger mucosus DSM 16094]
MRTPNPQLPVASQQRPGKGCTPRCLTARAGMACHSCRKASRVAWPVPVRIPHAGAVRASIYWTGRA